MSLPLRVISHVFRPRVQHLIFHVTDRCNLRCRHCFVDLTEKNTMTPATASQIAEQIGSLLWLDIGGGEPFLLDELPQLIEPFDCEVLGIPTNAHRPDEIEAMAPKILAATKAKDVVISVSIEGFREDHNEIRVNPKNYDLAFETLRRLHALSKREPRLRVKCNTVITNKNIDRLLEFMRFMRESRLVDFHSVVMLRGDPYKPEIELPYVGRLRAMRKDIFRILDSYLWGSGVLKRNFLRRYYRFLWDVSLDNLEQATQTIPCAGGTTHLVIWADGNVAPCELLPPIGNVHAAPLAEILASEAARRQVARIKAKECTCTHNCVMLDSILFNPRNYPGLLLAQ